MGCSRSPGQPQRVAMVRNAVAGQSAARGAPASTAGGDVVPATSAATSPGRLRSRIRFNQ
ncbi:protein of unassigned function [Methylobacterium oryzae CBMB20]|uniref:Protein of unassigned function n=1 Tax=Methylobacterium oryzae CBMB20 TaxID=693986 RepID=A0A089NWK2_9HYPH|nr:protein of unassigned function [Methylobacterium oryzae CBMB20]